MSRDHLDRLSVQQASERDAYRVALADALRPLEDPSAIQVTALRVLATWLGANRAYYVEVEPDEAHVVCASDYTDGVSSVVGRYRLADFSPFILAEYRAGRTLAFTDTADDPRVPVELRAAWNSLRIRAHVAVPLVKAHRFVAALGVDHATPRAWSANQLALIEETAERTWAAVERARANALVKRSHDTFLALIEQNPLGVYLVDASLRLVQVSAGSRTLFSGIEPLVGRDLTDVAGMVWRTPFVEELLARFRHTLDTGEPHHSPDTTTERRDGRVESYDWQIRRVTMPDGQFGVVCYFYETTSQVRAAREARFLADLTERIRLSEEPDHLLVDALGLLGGHLAVERAFLAEVDETNDRWRVTQDYHAGLASIAGEYRVSRFPADHRTQLHSQASTTRT